MNDYEVIVIGGWRTLRFSGCGFSRISPSSLKQLWVGHVFFRFGTSGLQEFVQAEEFAAEGAGVGGPSALAGQLRLRTTPFIWSVALAW